MTQIDRYHATDKDAFFASRRLSNGDEQSGVSYAYDHNLFSYQMTRMEGGKASIFYRMPTMDVIWNLLVMAFAPLMILSILRGVLYHARALIAQQNKVGD